MTSLADLGVARLRANNPSPLTLTGTNTWVVGHHPAWIVDPGPGHYHHLDAVAAAVRARGGAGGIALTHDHADHVQGVEALLERIGDVPVGAARGAPVQLGEGDTFGPLSVLHVPGHSDDHLIFVAGRAAFTGDAVLGSGSVFVSGALGEYLDGLRRLRELDLEVLCPGHGDEIWDPAAVLDRYMAHRLDRERRLLAALEAGLRTEDELLDAAWDDAPEQLRPAAAITMRAHLEKLRSEGRLDEFSGLRL
jgi:glyoxylase-like metal-dependent hydrolase (beta-lactamase superfamily II)